MQMKTLIKISVTIKVENLNEPQMRNAAELVSGSDFNQEGTVGCTYYQSGLG